MTRNNLPHDPRHVTRRGRDNLGPDGEGAEGVVGENMLTRPDHSKEHRDAARSNWAI